MNRFLLALVAMLFAGAAVAAGPESSDLPLPIQALMTTGVDIDNTMPAPDGFKGYVGVVQGTKMPIYLLPDGEHVLVGSLFDSMGNNLTMAPFREASAPVLQAGDWQKLADATWIAEGASDPDRIVYVFMDTECPYCHKIWKEAQPLLKGGKTQVRNVMVAVISPTKSAPRAAAILTANDPELAFREHQANFGHSPYPANGPVPETIRKKLDANAVLMQSLGLFGTPGVVYRDAAGKLRVHAGMPQTPELMRQIILGK